MKSIKNLNSVPTICVLVVRMRHKKVVVFIIVVMLILITVAFLLVYEGSPLNKFMRENEAQNLYDQAVEYYEAKDYESAIDTLQELIYGYGYWGDLTDTAASKKAQETKPTWEFEYAEYLMEEEKYVEGWEQLCYVFDRYPELELDASSSKMQEWTMEYARNNDELSQIDLGEGTAKNLGGNSEILIINDSPRALHIYTCGSTSTCITLEANPESSIKGFVFSWQGPSNTDVNATLTLPSGHLEMAIAAGKLVMYGDLNLESDTSYERWFYIQQLKY
jgi:hypothetical protein